MVNRPLTLKPLAEPLAVCRLPADAPLPTDPGPSPLWSVTRTADELSLVCGWPHAPAGARREGPWRALQVAGPLDFALTGVLASIAAPLAEAGVSIFAVSTFDTDYVLVREERLADAVAALRRAGHDVRDL